jgi:hypothetical protein
MRKLVSALAIAAGLALLAVPAQAQDNDNDDYIPTQSGMTVSESTVAPGESFTVSGEGAQPGATVTFRLIRSSSALGTGSRAVAAGAGLARAVAVIRPQAQSTVSLGSTTADADGSFSATLTIPSTTDPGVYTLTASSGGEVLATATIRVAAASAGGLPFTGSQVGPGLAIGATLIIAGGLLLLAVRRRRGSSAA